MKKLNKTAVLKAVFPAVGLGRNKILSLVQSAMGVAVYFLVIRYVVQTVGLEGVGLWSLTVGFVAMVRLMDLSGASGLARMVAMESDNPFKQADFIDTLTVFIALLYCILCLAAYQPLSHFLRDALDPDQWAVGHLLLAWALVSLPLNVISIAQLSAIDGIGRADIRSTLNILGFIVYGVLCLALIERNGIVALAYAQFAQFLVTMLAARLYLLKRIAPLGIFPLRISPAAARHCLGYGARLQISSLPMAFFEPALRIFIGRSAGLEYLGLYDLCYKLAVNMRMLIQAYLNPLVPEFTRRLENNSDSARSLFTVCNTQNLRIVSLAYGALILLSPLASVFILSELSTLFVLSTAILALGWGTATYALPTQLFARAAGVLKWAIFGQSLILLLGPASVYYVMHNLGQSWTVIAVAFSIVVGHAFQYVMETSVLKLKPVAFPDRRTALFTRAAIVGFFCLGLVAITWSLMHLPANKNL